MTQNQIPRQVQPDHW